MKCRDPIPEAFWRDSAITTANICRVKKQKGLGTSQSYSVPQVAVFPVRSRKKRQQETKVNYSFFSFIYLLSSIPTQQDRVLPEARVPAWYFRAGFCWKDGSRKPGLQIMSPTWERGLISNL